MLRNKNVTSVSIIVAVCLAACSNGGASAPGGVSQAAPTATLAAAATLPASPNPATGGAIDICSIVSVADVQPLVKDPITASPRSDLVGEASGCRYLTVADVGVVVTAINGDQAALAWSQTEQGPTVSGVGDQAMREPGSAIVSAIKENVFCSVDISELNDSAYVGLSPEDANGNTPDDSAGPFAQKLGALCDKIFAAQ